MQVMLCVFYKGKKKEVVHAAFRVSEAQAAAFLSQINQNLVFLICVDAISFATLRRYESSLTDHTVRFKY